MKMSSRSRNQLRLCLIAALVVMAHADDERELGRRPLINNLGDAGGSKSNIWGSFSGGSKSSKNGKSGGGRWSIGSGRWSGRGNRWKSSKNKWSSSRGGDDDDNYYDDDDNYDDDSNGGRLPLCTLANPVQEQYEVIERSWLIAYPPAKTAEALKAFKDDTIAHANMVMEQFMKAVEGFEDDDFDKDDVFNLGEFFGKNHPTSVKFTTDDQQEAVCSQTKALVLMMKDSCFYERWKRTFEIVAYHWMDGFIEGANIDMNLGKCISFAVANRSN